MAKQIGVVQISGALGEVVGAKKSAGQKHNIIRVRAYEPKNPRTDLQMIQRIKSKAATNIYSALKGILDHSFEGVKYGAPSRNFFMQQAMTMAEGTFPWLVKGDANPVPGEMLLSKGSLLPISVYLEQRNLYNPAFKYSEDDLPSSFSIATLKLKDFSAQFNASNGTKDGDQLTFVVFAKVVANGSQIFYLPVYCRIVLDSTATDDVLFIDSLSSNSIRFAPDDDLHDLQFAVNDDVLGNVSTESVAGAIIVSRPSVNGDVVEWQRSTTYITISEDADFQALFDEDAKKKAFASFKKALNPKSAWYLNQGKLS